MSYYVTRCLEALSELRAKGFPVPPALTVDEPQPLALTTREDIGAYVALHGGGEDEARLLGQAVASITRTPRYQEALAADLSARVSILTGEAVGLVSEPDRLSAALQINAKALRATPKPPPPQTPKPPPPPPAETHKASAAAHKPPAPAPSPFAMAAA